MKTLAIAATVLLALPLGSALADEAKAPSPVEVCQNKAAFLYHVDMMSIEREELDKKISHDTAASRKLTRHALYLGEVHECEELKKD